MKNNESELKNIVEAALLAAEEPLSVAALTSLFPEDAAPAPGQLKEVFAQLEDDYEGRGVELRRVGKGWRFQSREKYSPWLRKLTESRPPRYSRAFLETLAIVAYRQPVTRGDIEEIRGVQVSSDIMRSLMDRDWVKEVGHRDVPGRPALLGTTQQFLEYFNLETLSELPPLLERREAADIARELNLRLPLEGEDNAVRHNGGDAGAGESSGTWSDDDPGEAAGAGVDDDTPATRRDVDQGLQEDAGAASRRDEPVDGTGGDRDAEYPRPEDDTEESPDSRRGAKIIPFDDALSSREGDGEAS